MVMTIAFSCNDENYNTEYAPGYPNILAGNWVVFQFQGGNLNGSLTGPYDMSTALDPNQQGQLIVDNIYNTGNRARAEIRGDTGWFYAQEAEQLELINKGNFGVEQISIDGYINQNPVLANFVYGLATQSFENISFREEDITEIIFFRAGLYDEYSSLVDSIMVMGYRKTGFEDVDYNY